jgi:hypothetical protein
MPIDRTNESKIRCFASDEFRVLSEKDMIQCILTRFIELWSEMGARDEEKKVAP